LTWTVNSDFAVPAGKWPAQQLYLRLGVAAARRLDARLLRVNLGGRAGEPEAADDRVAKRLARFVGASQRWYPGLLITVENHWGLSADLDRHLLLLARARNLLPGELRGRLGACFDPDNMPRGDQRRRWWRGLARVANHYHFATTAFDALGSDVGLPHAFLLSLLREAGYQGACTIEFQGDGDPARGIRCSRELFERLAQPASQ
jgi:sugar phosphate isomerase/epimerase